MSTRKPYELLRHYKLDTEFLPDRVRHVTYPAESHRSRRKAVEEWNFERDLGSGGSSKTVRLEKQILTGQLRAVKVIEKQRVTINYDRALEALTVGGLWNVCLRLPLPKIVAFSSAELNGTLLVSFVIRSGLWLVRGCPALVHRDGILRQRRLEPAPPKTLARSGCGVRGPTGVRRVGCNTREWVHAPQSQTAGTPLSIVFPSLVSYPARGPHPV
jgi:hypothetical protein